MDRKSAWETQLNLQEINRGNRFGFISTELDLAITFCEIALGTRNHQKFERNLANAQSAYIAARHFMNDRHLTIFERDRIREQVIQLDELLEQLNVNGDLSGVRRAASHP